MFVETRITPAMVSRFGGPTGFVLALTILSVLFAMGIARHAAAALLWYGWACLFNRNVLISNPSIPYIGLLLVLVLLVPAREPLRVGGREASAEFYMPGAVFWTAWCLMAAGYTFSGIAKLQSPSWIDGSALSHILLSPLARSTVLTEFVLGHPSLLVWTTWAVVELEVLFLPLALYSRTRAFAWSSMVAMHVAIVALIDFADLSAGMLVLHLFTLDQRWLSSIRRAARDAFAVGNPHKTLRLAESFSSFSGRFLRGPRASVTVRCSQRAGITQW